LEGQQFTTPQAGGQFQIESGQQSSFFRFGKIQADFLLRRDLSRVFSSRKYNFKIII